MSIMIIEQSAVLRKMDANCGIRTEHVIESLNNSIIGVGDLDYILPANGTLLVLQNLTWNGAQGFQSRPETDFYVPYHPEYNGGFLSGAGNLGKYVTERGLTFYTVGLAGHGTSMLLHSTP